VIVKQPLNEEAEKEIDKLKDDFIELQQNVTELRKKGQETEIADVMLLDMPAKIKMAKMTQDSRDIKIARKYLDSIKEELNEIEHGSEFDRVTTLIEEAFDLARKGDKKMAKERYREIMALYRILPKDLKKTAFDGCIELRKRLDD